MPNALKEIGCGVCVWQNQILGDDDCYGFMLAERAAKCLGCLRSLLIILVENSVVRLDKVDHDVEDAQRIGIQAVSVYVNCGVFVGISTD